MPKKHTCPKCGHEFTNARKTNRDGLPKGARWGWHFMPKDRKLRYGDNRKVKLNETYQMPSPGKPQLCVRGMHGGKGILRGTLTGAGPILSRVLVWGEIDHRESGMHRDKFAGRYRKHVWWGHLSRKDLQACARALGISIYTYSYMSRRSVQMDRNQLIRAIRCSGSKNLIAAEKWLLNWAKERGCPNV